MTTEKQNKLLGICASIGLHGLVAAILIFGLSESAMTPRDLGKFNFTWVSLAAKDKNSFSPVEEKYKKQSTVSPAGAKPETSAVQNSRVESTAMVVSTEAASYGRTNVAAENKEGAQALAGVHNHVSNGGKVSGILPAFSSAYPLYRENPPPGYPEMARQQGYEGVVLVQAEILVDGRVGQTVISKSSGYAILDQTAVKAVRAWKFEPAKKSGVPCKTWAELPIKFVISDNNSQS